MDFHAGKNIFESYLLWYPKINSICILDLNGKDKTIKYLVSNTEKYQHHPGVGRDFLHRTDIKSSKPQRNKS